MTWHLAIDIGASSGRHILGAVVNGKLVTEEIYRFENYILKENGTLVWDIGHLWDEVKAGIAKCGESGRYPATVAVDTWGVDYVLIDAQGNEILPAVSYRDSRTAAVPDEIAAVLSQQALYARTGIQKQNFNTVYQLYCDKKSGKLDGAKHFLMIPDYISYKLTGVMKNEYTNASTTNLINAKTKTWDREILSLLGLPDGIFFEPSMPGGKVGCFDDEIRSQVGFDSTVVLCPSHDTASAVAACPIGDDGVYISSGTWSLIGTENTRPVLSAAAMNANFTNEGGIDGRCRFLKNIMGMWLFQNVRRDLDKKHSYDEMMRMAQKSGFVGQIDPNDAEFVAPDSMIEAVRRKLGRPELAVGDVLNSIYHSLARSYADAVREIETIGGKSVDVINIIGGGSKDAYLNRLTRRYTGKRVFAGPVEATSVGNLISQLMYTDPTLTLEKARELVKTSFDIQEVL